jgi:outer membrane protein
MLISWALFALPSLSGAKEARVPDPVAQVCKGHVRQGCRGATWVAGNAPLPDFAPEPEAAPTETLAQALDAAYRAAPALQAQRYQLRATDETYAQALSEFRPTTQLQVTGAYDKTVPGRTTQQARFSTDPIITSNTLAATASVTQPLYTGGKASADRDAALAGVIAGRAQLRGVEGDLLLQVITAYADVRRDDASMRLYGAHVRQLEQTLAEVKARREAGELTRTDIAQAESQLELGRAQLNTTGQQFQVDRATFAALVGHDPGVLAVPPGLPGLPESVDDALDLADQLNPGLAQAIATERESRAKIGSAAAQGRPTISLNASATATGQAWPYYLHNEDQQFQGQAVLTIPLTNGGRVGALVAQAQDQNAADRIGIETARRHMVQAIVSAWNGIAAAERNIAVGEAGLTAARVFDDGTFQEYRAGLRSTFDVLFAHETLVNAEVTLEVARHDLYVAEASLLRQVGLLEARSLLTGTGLYDPQANFRHAERRGALIHDGLIEAADSVARPRPAQKGLEQPPLGADSPALAHAFGEPAAEPATHSPTVPKPGTSGTPLTDRSLKQP